MNDLSKEIGLVPKNDEEQKIYNIINEIYNRPKREIVIEEDESDDVLCYKDWPSYPNGKEICDLIAEGLTDYSLSKINPLTIKVVE